MSNTLEANSAKPKDPVAIRIPIDESKRQMSAGCYFGDFSCVGSELQAVFDAPSSVGKNAGRKRFGLACS